jgi:hypothetical protein
MQQTLESFLQAQHHQVFQGSALATKGVFGAVAREYSRQTTAGDWMWGKLDVSRSTIVSWNGFNRDVDG